LSSLSHPASGLLDLALLREKALNEPLSGVATNADEHLGGGVDLKGLTGRSDGARDDAPGSRSHPRCRRPDAANQARNERGASRNHRPCTAADNARSLRWERPNDAQCPANELGNRGNDPSPSCGRGAYCLTPATPEDLDDPRQERGDGICCRTNAIRDGPANPGNGIDDDGLCRIPSLPEPVDNSRKAVVDSSLGAVHASTDDGPNGIPGRR